MDINFENNSIVVFGKKAKLDAVMSKFVQLNGDQLSHFLKNRAIRVPRRLHLLALMKVLNRKVKDIRSNSLSGDFFVRLQYYKDFTEEQYAILFDKIASDDPEAFLEYRYNFVKLLFLNNAALDFNDGEINYIRNISKEKMEKFIKYVWLVDNACVDQEDTFDGVLIDDVKKNLPVTATAHDIRAIGKKYGVSVPERLNKEQLLEYIQDFLGKKLSAKDFESLSNMSLNQIGEFCKKLNIEMSPKLTKNELVIYLFYLLGKKKIEKSTIKELVVPEEGYTPFEFTVDLDAIDPFGNKGEPKKVIHYEGEEEDEALEKENIVLVEDKIEEDVVEAPAKFTLSFDNLEHGQAPEELKELEAIPEFLPVLEDEKYNFVGWYLDKEFEKPVEANAKLEADTVLYAKWEEKEEPVVALEPQVEEAPAEEPAPEVVEEVVNEQPVEAEAAPETPEEAPEAIEPAVEPADDKLTDSKAVKNELYGSNKVRNAGKNKAKYIVFACFLAALIGVLVTFLVLLFV